MISKKASNWEQLLFLNTACRAEFQKFPEWIVYVNGSKNKEKYTFIGD